MKEDAPIPVSLSSLPETGSFYVIEPSAWGDGKGPGLEIVNKKALRLPGTFMIEPPNGEADQYPERPLLAHVPELGGMPRDFEEVSSQWIVSEALKQAFESLDPQGFAFSACEFTLADGSIGPQYYFCGVLRWIDALDEAASDVKIRYETDHRTGEQLKFYSVAGGARLVFRDDVVGGAHIFRQPRLGTDAICDHVLASGLRALALEGVRIRDAARL